MKITLSGSTLTLHRETGDPKFYGAQNGAGESNLLHFLKERLNEMGFDLIKKRMYKDGHLVDDLQQYLRVKNKWTDAPHVAIYNGHWAISGANEDWNKQGRVSLQVEFDYCEKQPDSKERMLRLLGLPPAPPQGRVFHGPGTLMAAPK